MKRTLCLLMATVLLLCVFSACAKKDENPLLMYELLRKKGYDVSMRIDQSSINNDMYNLGIAFLIEEEDVRYTIRVYPKERGEHGVVQTHTVIGFFVLCTNNKTAKNLEKELDDDHTKKIDDSVDNVVIKRKGALVFVGDETVWKDFK